MVKLLRNAEDYLRNSQSNTQINNAIISYTDIRKKCMNMAPKDYSNAIYFNHKCINLAKRYNMIKQLIESLLDMGDCFSEGKSKSSSSTNDLILSMIFKEESKTLVSLYLYLYH